MQFVRCDGCGAKAILAASRCPKCSRSLELRDHHGEFVPMGRCRDCGSHYVLSRGGCKWCTPRAAQATPSHRKLAVVGAVAVSLTVAVAAGFLWNRRDGSLPSAVQTAEAGRQTDESTAPIGGEDSASPARSSDEDSLAGTLIAAEVPRPRPTTADSIAIAESAAARSQRPRFDLVGGPWTPMRATTWVNVRASPYRNAAVVGVVTPDVRVMLGVTRDGWRRVQAPGIVGWVDGSLFEMAAEGRTL